MDTELPQITAAVGLAYEMALQRYNNNYSASRATIAGQEKKFKNYRDELASGFCTPMWDQVIDWGIRKGYIEAPGYLQGDWRFRQAVLAVTWIGPSPINIDPKKEVEAHILAINAGLETREQACRELFQTDYEETVDRIKKEMEIMPPTPTEVRDVNITRDDEENA
jgi:capsid protein